MNINSLISEIEIEEITIQSVIASCRTQEQLQVTGNWVTNLYNKWINKGLSLNKKDKSTYSEYLLEKYNILLNLINKKL